MVVQGGSKTSNLKRFFKDIASPVEESVNVTSESNVTSIGPNDKSNFTQIGKRLQTTKFLQCQAYCCKVHLRKFLKVSSLGLIWFKILKINKLSLV